MQAGGISAPQCQGWELLFVGELPQTIGLLGARWDFRRSTEVSAAFPTAVSQQPALIQARLRYQQLEAVAHLLQ